MLKVLSEKDSSFHFMVSVLFEILAMTKGFFSMYFQLK